MEWHLVWNGWHVRIARCQWSLALGVWVQILPFPDGAGPIASVMRVGIFYTRSSRLPVWLGLVGAVARKNNHLGDCLGGWHAKCFNLLQAEFKGSAV